MTQSKPPSPTTTAPYSKGSASSSPKFSGDLLLVEDDPALSELLDFQFTRAGFTVRKTADGDEALLLATEKLPDLIVLDWMVEGSSGIEVCRQLRRRPASAQVPIIMLTAREAEEDRIRGLEIGADDYVTKPFSPRELLARIGALLRRSRPALVGEQISVGDLILDPTAHMVQRDGADLQLGPTEFRLLQYFMERPENVLSRGQLLDGVWGTEKDIELRTVDVHIKRLRQAIYIEGYPDPLRTVRSMGYKLVSAT